MKREPTELPSPSPPPLLPSSLSLSSSSSSYYRQNGLLFSCYVLIELPRILFKEYEKKIKEETFKL
ncbi:hypothetical protein DERF_003270 [Dermatophagoides farinae]|uniref:Uncharacterized protein n=1 Tax=Dermatophagoides farinae TaxID=6954 RepID=A0A922IH27_DERFA|nr:hypothetical protein DERF_003270 [Dermatophagoides farinae]